MSFQPPSRLPSRPRLLIVDDDPAVLDVTRSMARSFGCHSLMADNAQQGLELFREHADSLDAVLVDLNMPGIGGIELIRLIREHRADAHVLMMTGGHVDEACLTEAGIPADCLLNKPFSLARLKSAVIGGEGLAEAA
jgi:CheY-like chemotaxis protein